MSHRRSLREIAAGYEKSEAWEQLSRQRMGAVADKLQDGETVEDHGVIRVHNMGRRGWTEGFMVITDRRFMFVAPPTITTMMFAGVQDFHAKRKIFTGDLIVDIDGKRLRFNGGKTFVFLCCRALSQQR
jgi:hypothetical protein